MVKEENIDNGLKSVQFERSPNMSTYLLAMVVGEYDFVETKDSDGVVVRVYTPLGKKEQGTFALSVSATFAGFFGVFNYSLIVLWGKLKDQMIRMPVFRNDYVEANVGKTNLFGHFGVIIVVRFLKNVMVRHEL